MYNLGFFVGGKYINDWQNGKGADKEKLDRGYTFTVKLENEFIFTENFTVGLDLFFNANDKIKYTVAGAETKWNSYNEYGFNLDGNFALAENNYIGAYFDMAFSDLKGPKTSTEKYKNPVEYKFGLRYTSQF